MTKKEEIEALKFTIRQLEQERHFIVRWAMSQYSGKYRKLYQAYPYRLFLFDEDMPSGPKIMIGYWPSDESEQGPSITIYELHDTGAYTRLKEQAEYCVNRQKPQLLRLLELWARARQEFDAKTSDKPVSP